MELGTHPSPGDLFLASLRGPLSSVLAFVDPILRHLSLPMHYTGNPGIELRVCGCHLVARHLKVVMLKSLYGFGPSSLQTYSYLFLKVG